MAKKTEIQDKIENRDRIHVVMFFLSIVFFILGILIMARIIGIQTGYEVDDRVVGLFRTTVTKHTDRPVRGRILAADGRPMAISAPLYDIHMDCTVRKQEFLDNGNEEGERKWREKAGELSRCLSREFRDRSADDYLKAIIAGRENGARYLKIKNDVDLTTLNRLKTYPLFNENTNRGGMIVERHEERIYPYDSLARRVIGYVKENNRIGLEHSFDSELHGQEGYEWRRVTDKKTWIRDLDSATVKVKDGNDIRTTLNVDFQDIADKALRAQIDANDDVRAGICIIMEAKTGAIRAMGRPRLGCMLSAGNLDSMVAHYTAAKRRRGEDYELDLVLRNNRTSDEHPLGIFHPHAEVHHIKKENIGLIEVMGLAVLPARLKAELTAVAEALLSGKDLNADSQTVSHADWALDVKARHPELNRSNVTEILRQEVGSVFASVLEDAGVFKRTEAGKASFRRFLTVL